MISMLKPSSFSFEGAGPLVSDSALCTRDSCPSETGLSCPTHPLCVVLLRLIILRDNPVVVTPSRRRLSSAAKWLRSLVRVYDRLPQGSPFRTLGTWEDCQSWIIDRWRYIVLAKTENVRSTKNDREGEQRGASRAASADCSAPSTIACHDNASTAFLSVNPVICRRP